MVLAQKANSNKQQKTNIAIAVSTQVCALRLSAP